MAKRNLDIGSLRTKLVCRLHAQIASLAAGGIAKELNASDADGLLGGQYAVKAGWDACSGWGTPDGEKLLNALK